MKTAQQRGKANRNKGKKGEREFAQLLRDYGYPARRGAQYSGKTGQADVEGFPGYHVEVTVCSAFPDDISLRKSSARRVISHSCRSFL